MWTISDVCNPGVLTLEQFRYAIAQLPDPNATYLSTDRAYLVQLPKKFKGGFNLDEEIPIEMEMVSYHFTLARYAKVVGKDKHGLDKMEYKNSWVFSGKIIAEDLPQKNKYLEHLPFNIS